MPQQALGSDGKFAGEHGDKNDSKFSTGSGERGPAFPNAGQVQGSALAASAAVCSLTPL